MCQAALCLAFVLGIYGLAQPYCTLKCLLFALLSVLPDGVVLDHQGRLLFNSAQNGLVTLTRACLDCRLVLCAVSDKVSSRILFVSRCSVHVFRVEFVDCAALLHAEVLALCIANCAS